MNATMSASQTERITLYYREGSSDKVYQATIEPRDGLFVVNFAFGRRGSTLQTGTKTAQPIDYDPARKLYDKLVREKQAKGYTEGPDGAPYQHSEKKAAGLLPQLLNPIDEDEARALIEDDDWCAQEKFDGKRLLVRKQNATIEGINKKGIVVGLSEPLFQVIRQYGADVVLDGEGIGDTFHAFDLLVLDGVDIRSWPYRERLTALVDLLASVQQRVIRLVETAYTTGQKRQLLAKLRAGQREGIVFKQVHSTYTAGRPNSGGMQLKHKFYATCSAVVAKVNGQRSVELRLLDAQGWQSVGNVTIPVNFPVPEPGQVVEIRFLYAFKQSHALYQPVYLGRRQDVEPQECVLAQLKYKAGDGEEPC